MSDDKHAYYCRYPNTKCCCDARLRWDPAILWACRVALAALLFLAVYYVGWPLLTRDWRYLFE